VKSSTLLAIVFFLTSNIAFAQKSKWISEGWLLFLKAKFEPKYFKQLDETYLSPVFPPSIKAKVGGEVSLSGYYMPFDMDEHRVILSKYPYAACFFCGGAGPESVVEVVFIDNAPKLEVDDVISVKGKLRLNDKDVERMNFILYDAVVLEQ
jgi:hypothetical protein